MATMGIGSGTEQWLITATVAGANAGTWDAMDGGDADSETGSPYRRGDGTLMDRGGPRTWDEITISRIWDGDRDRAVEWMGLRGRASMTVTVTEKDADGNPAAAGITYTGTLKKVSAPKPNSNATGEVMISLTMIPSGAA